MRGILLLVAFFILAIVAAPCAVQAQSRNGAQQTRAIFEDLQYLLEGHGNAVYHSKDQTGAVNLRPHRALLHEAKKTRTLTGIRSKTPLAEPDYSVYHKTDQLLQEARAVVGRHQDIMSEEVLSEAHGDYKANITVITVDWDNPQSPPDNKLRIFLDFGQHGREPVTSEVGLRLLQVLAGEVQYPPRVNSRVVKRFLPSITFKIVPMENVNGRRLVEAGDYCERKNGRGVDPNRNWSIDWGVLEKDYDPAEEYPGEGPFSEPEAAIIRQVAAEFEPHVWVNVHSGMEALFMPFDHVFSTPKDGSAEPMQDMLHAINLRHCGDRCRIGSGGGSVGYLAHGTATDYMFQELRIPIAYTWEIYGETRASYADCFRLFNPVTAPIFQEVVSNWTGAFLTMVTLLPGTLRRMPQRLRPCHAWKDRLRERLGRVPVGEAQAEKGTSQYSSAAHDVGIVGTKKLVLGMGDKALSLQLTDDGGEEEEGVGEGAGLAVGQQADGLPQTGTASWGGGDLDVARGVVLVVCIAVVLTVVVVLSDRQRWHWRWRRLFAPRKGASV